MIETTLLVIHFLVAITLIVLVLLQHGKGADAGAAFGAGASATVFGARGAANFLSRATAIAAAIFFLSSLSLGYLLGHRAGEGSVLDKVAPTQVPSSTEVPSSRVDGPILPVEPSREVPVAPPAGVTDNPVLPAPVKQAK